MSLKFIIPLAFSLFASSCEKDSILANENWKFVNGKIAYSTAYEAKPAPK